MISLHNPLLLMIAETDLYLFIILYHLIKKELIHIQKHEYERIKIIKYSIKTVFVIIIF